MADAKLIQLTARLLGVLGEPASVFVAWGDEKGPWGLAYPPGVHTGKPVGTGPFWGTIVIGPDSDADATLAVVAHELAHLAVWRLLPAADYEALTAAARRLDADTRRLFGQGSRGFWLQPPAARPPAAKPDSKHGQIWGRAACHLLWRLSFAGLIAPWPVALGRLGIEPTWRLMRVFLSEAATLRYQPITSVLARPMPRRAARLFNNLGILE